MRPADDPSADYRAVVRNGYDRCASDYAGERQRTPERELALITDELPAGASVLDVGCGAGVPTARHLAKTLEVTGIDTSESMIRLARENVPTGRFIHGDATAVDFAAESFDAIVSFYAVFHIPREEHRALFSRFSEWLKPSGLLLVTVAESDDGPGYTESDFFGVTMYWSYYGPNVYRDMLQETGFQIVAEGVIGHGYGTAEVPDERHPYFLARRRCESKGVA